ncbi:MAG: hypothetical protein CM15mP88_2230 [Pseudomonadota bacterium]|nr:MAG: hypothetical protein CM15mP88_2230 [Pseudomonadota bacterium]
MDQSDSETILEPNRAPYINEVMHMEPLTINGILGAARHLEQIRHY